MEKACLCYKKENIPEEMALLSVAWLLSLWLCCSAQAFRDSSGLKLSTWGKFSESIRPLTWLYLISSPSSFNTEKWCSSPIWDYRRFTHPNDMFLASFDMWLLQMVHLKFKQVIFLNSNSHLKNSEETATVECVQIVKWSTISP